MPDAAAGAPEITAIILTYNEAIHIERCITRLRRLVRRIVVIDSYSTDSTVGMAQALGADVLQNAWTNHADQLTWGLEHAGIDTEWILRVDADEYLEHGLADEVLRIHTRLDTEVTGLDFRLKVIFQDRPILWGGYHETMLTRMWRRGAGRIERRWMDERLVLTRGRSQVLRGGDLIDHNLKDLTWWTQKHNDYATRQMVDFVLRERRRAVSATETEGLNRQAKWKRFLRNNVYARAPLYVRAVLYFVQRYFLRMGFLDGRSGFVWHFLQGFWFFVLIDAKIDEARGIIQAEGYDAFTTHLKARHGIDLRLDADRQP